MQGNTFDFSGYAERLGVEVHLLERLQSPAAGIFEEVEGATLDAILSRSEILSFTRKSRPVFVEGQPTTDCLYLILDGQFSINYKSKTPSDPKPKLKAVAFNETPMLLGDVEFLVQSLNLEGPLRVEKNSYLSTVKCEKPGRVLKINQAQSAVWSNPSLPLIRNMARLLAVKLTRGEARSTTPPRYKILEHLRELTATDRKIREIEKNGRKHFRLSEPISYRSVAEAIGLHLNTIYACYDSTLKERGLVWYESDSSGWTFTMSSDFYNVLISEQWESLLRGTTLAAETPSD